jgi:phosphoribosylaminoimidazole-succinocarboxamide synthase
MKLLEFKFNCKKYNKYIDEIIKNTKKEIQNVSINFERIIYKCQKYTIDELKQKARKVNIKNTKHFDKNEICLLLEKTLV